MKQLVARLGRIRHLLIVPPVWYISLLALSVTQEPLASITIVLSSHCTFPQSSELVEPYLRFTLPLFSRAWLFTSRIQSSKGCPRWCFSLELSIKACLGFFWSVVGQLWRYPSCWLLFDEATFHQDPGNLTNPAEARYDNDLVDFFPPGERHTQQGH